MLPAERKHYRKGLALGLTMAETFSIIVFILLLACAVLLIKVSNARDAVQNDLQERTADYAMAKHMLMLQNGAPSGANTDAWLQESRRLREGLDDAERRIEDLRKDSLRAQAEAEQLRHMLESENVPSKLRDDLAKQAGEIESLNDSLNQANDALEDLERQQESMNRQLQEARQIGEAAREVIARHEDLDSAEADSVLQKAARADVLADSLDIARGAIASLETGRAMWDSLASVSSADSLRTVAARERMRADRFAAAEQERDEAADRLASARRERDAAIDRLAVAGRERDEAIDRAEFREEEIRRLRGGRGIDPPPCWLDDEDNPEYIFRAVLTNGGIKLFKIAPPHRRDDPATPYLSSIKSGQNYAPQEFLDLTRPIYEAGLTRKSFGPMGCRYWIRPVDETGDRKDVFREREAQLWTRFWFRW